MKQTLFLFGTVTHGLVHALILPLLVFMLFERAKEVIIHGLQI
jgi:hypothetical protein